MRSVPSPDLSNWRKFFLTSAICSGEMSACRAVGGHQWCVASSEW